METLSMFSAPWIRAWMSRYLRPRSACSCVRPRRSLPLLLEALEERSVPATISWVNPAGGDWDSASNWSTDAVPGAGDDVVINALNAGSTVTHSTAVSDAVNSLSSQVPLVLSSGSLSIANTSTINNALTVEAGALQGPGDVTVTGHLIVSGGTLSGGGSLTAAGGAALSGAALSGYTLVIPPGQSASLDQVTSVVNGSVLDNQGTLTVSASGNWPAGLVTNGSGGLLKNEGTIYTAQTSYLLLSIDSPGDIIAQNGNLALGNASTGSTSTFGGRIDATQATAVQVGGQVTLTATVSLDATVVAWRGCSAQVAGSYRALYTDLFDADVAMTGTVAALGGLDLSPSLAAAAASENYLPPGLPGGLNLQGSTLDLTGATLVTGSTDLAALDVAGRGTLLAAADWTVSGPVSLSGNLDAAGGRGTLTAAGGAALSGITALSGYTLVIPPGQSATLEARTDLDDGSVLDNQGTLTLNGTGYFGFGFVEGAAPALLKNEGTIHTNQNSFLEVSIDSPGDIVVDNGSLNLGYGGPSYTTASTFGGRIDATNATGLAFLGQVTLTPTSSVGGTAVTLGESSLDLQLGGATPGAGFAQIQVGSSVSLGGQLQLDLVNGFTPYLGEKFTIVNNNGTAPVIGTFSSLVSPLGYQFQINYADGHNQNNVTLTVTQVPATTTALTSSGSPSVLGQPVTFTATVSGVSPGLPTPTGSVDFVDTMTHTDLGTVPLSNGTAALTTSALAAGSQVIEAIYDGQGIFLGSNGTLTQQVNYHFSGFLPPLGQLQSYALGRTIPVKFQLTDYKGNAITSLSAVTSLQVAPVVNGVAGTPFAPASTNNQGLQASGGQYLFTWQTKGLSAGTYEILLTLADGTTHAIAIQLTTSGNSGKLESDGSGGSSGATAGALLGGDVALYVDNGNGDLTGDELARIDDAVAAVDATLAPYSVTITEVGSPALANITLDMETTSVVGGHADGVLGCTTDAGQVTLIQGWDWYAGSDPGQVGSGQYDFQTVVTHELGHVFGLGHSTDASSVMYATLAPGTARRALATADLNVPDTDGAACGLHAVLPVTPSVAPTLASAGTDAMPFLTPIPATVSKAGAKLAGDFTSPGVAGLVESVGPASVAMGVTARGAQAGPSLSAAAVSGDPPAFQVAVGGRGTPPLLDGAAAAPEETGGGADVQASVMLPTDPSLPDCREPAEQAPTPAASPGPAPEESGQPSAGAVDNFFRGVGQSAAGLIRAGRDEGQADGPAPRALATGGPALLALLGAHSVARGEEPESRKRGRPRRG
jgi:hypothetical protein